MVDTPPEDLPKPGIEPTSPISPGKPSPEVIRMQFSGEGREYYEN